MEVLVFAKDPSRANSIKSSLPREPVSNLANGRLVVAAVSFNIASSEVGQSCLISIPLFFENKNYLIGLLGLSELFAAEIKSKLKWHIQPIVLAR